MVEVVHRAIYYQSSNKQSDDEPMSSLPPLLFNFSQSARSGQLRLKANNSLFFFAFSGCECHMSEVSPPTMKGHAC